MHGIIYCKCFSYNEDLIFLYYLLVFTPSRKRYEAAAAVAADKKNIVSIFVSKHMDIVNINATTTQTLFISISNSFYPSSVVAEREEQLQSLKSHRIQFKCIINCHLHQTESHAKYRNAILECY